MTLKHVEPRDSQPMLEVNIGKYGRRGDISNEVGLGVRECSAPPLRLGIFTPTLS